MSVCQCVINLSKSLSLANSSLSFLKDCDRKPFQACFKDESYSKNIFSTIQDVLCKKLGLSTEQSSTSKKAGFDTETDWRQTQFLSQVQRQDCRVVGPSSLLWWVNIPCVCKDWWHVCPTGTRYGPLQPSLHDQTGACDTDGGRYRVGVFRR